MSLMFWRVLFGIASFGLVSSTVFLVFVITAAARFNIRAKELQGSVSEVAREQLPSVTIFKPVHGMEERLDRNLESFFQQDYPAYEIIIGARSADDPAITLAEQLRARYTQVKSRIVISGPPEWPNAKVFTLDKMIPLSENVFYVVSDSDVRVRPDYLRSLIAPLASTEVGAVTCLYLSTGEKTFIDKLQSIAMISDFYPGLFVARELEGVKFALGPSIATTRAHLARFGGYEKIKNQPADDLLIGRLIAEEGYKVELSSYSIQTVADYQSVGEFVHKRMRWLVVMRHMRPKGHFGLLFTQALPWLPVALAAHPTLTTGVALFLTYLGFRVATIWLVGIRGLKRPLWGMMPLVVLWDLLAFSLWITSFGKNTIRWRGDNYYIRDGNLVPATTR